MNKTLIITNNNKVYEKHKDKRDVLFLEKATHIEVLEKTRDLIHKGARLLSHPLAGSLKPNQTPYRSILLEKPSGMDPEKPSIPVLDIESLRLMENSIELTKRILAVKSIPQWPSKIREDFKTVDLSIIDNAIN